MHQIFQAIVQTAKWSMATPARRHTTQIVARGLGIWYRQLAPHDKRKVNAILKKGAIKLSRLAIGDVVHWAAGEALAQGLNQQAVQIVEKGVQRVAEIGLDRAMKEIERS